MYHTTPRAPDHPYTLGARRSITDDLAEGPSVVSRAELAQIGIGDTAVTAQLRARRWQKHGLAIIRHNGPVTRLERWHIGRINCGPRALFTSFTAAELSGLRGWERDEAHLLVPVGTRHHACLV